MLQTHNKTASTINAAAKKVNGWNTWLVLNALSTDSQHLNSNTAVTKKWHVLNEIGNLTYFEKCNQCIHEIKRSILIRLTLVRCTKKKVNGISERKTTTITTSEKKQRKFRLLVRLCWNASTLYVHVEACFRVQLCFQHHFMWWTEININNSMMWRSLHKYTTHTLRNENRLNTINVTFLLSPIWINAVLNGMYFHQLFRTKHKSILKWFDILYIQVLRLNEQLINFDEISQCKRLGKML